MPDSAGTPRFAAEAVERIAEEVWGLRGELRKLPSYVDQNFLIRPETGDAVVLKIAHAAEDPSVLDLQHRGLERLAVEDPGLGVPRLMPTRNGEEMVRLGGTDGAQHYCRVLTYLPGRLMAEVRPQTTELLTGLGRFLGRLDRALAGLEHPAAARAYEWDLRRAGRMRDLLAELSTPRQQEIAGYCFLQFDAHAARALADLPQALIHNDANDYNLLVAPDREEIAGIIDFGDMLRSARIAEPAIACAYAMLNKDDPLGAACAVARGYHAEHPLEEREIDVLFPLILARLCSSACMSARGSRLDPDNEYLLVSAPPVWELLERLVDVAPGEAAGLLRESCGMPVARGGQHGDELLQARRRYLSPSLSLAYAQPLQIVRGSMQHLFDDRGRGYLDLVNNVCHVGHCHPRVVEAAQQQIARLNTNTRYLHEHIVTYARRLAATFPEPLEVCFFVCSGSEANELALRLARAHTGRTDLVVIDGAYHGNTTALVEISPYKFDGPGGAGRPGHVHVAPMPDPLRGPFRGDDSARRYAESAMRTIAGAGKRLAAFIAEPLMGCAGQILLPPGYLAAAFGAARAEGAVCIADEVQVGFGRTGESFWGFETQDVVPDVVTLGKPMGNGHPLGAVVTTRAVAESFDAGMEYFNTFGGNPVSCAIGLAVLDVIEEEGLQQRARRVGRRLIEGLHELARDRPRIGDVRGMGLFAGVELIGGAGEFSPAAGLATTVVERMKRQGFLLSVDGPLRNVIKIKPPMVVHEDDVALLLVALERVLDEEV